MNSLFSPRPALARIGISAYFTVLALIALRGAYPELARIRLTVLQANADDFWGYYTAALLVRTHSSAPIYEEALWNVDPVEDYAAPNTVFAATARSYGVSAVPLYDYPPTLADLLVPLTFLSPKAALDLWIFLSMAAVVGSGFLIGRLVGLHSAMSGGGIILSLLLFRPTLNSFAFAQAAVLLLFLVLVGIWLYANDRPLAAGFAFSLATAIKLTPLVVIVPLIVWRDWKALRAMLASITVILIALFVINGPVSLDGYFVQEIPKMAHRTTDADNRGLANAVQVLILGTGGTPVAPGFLWFGRAVSALLIGAAGWLCRRPRSSASVESRAEILSVFFLISACASPVSWLHAFVLAAPALAFACRRIGTSTSNMIETATVLVFVISLSTYTFVRLEMLTPFLGGALALSALRPLILRNDLPPGSSPARSVLLPS